MTLDELLERLLALPSSARTAEVRAATSDVDVEVLDVRYERGEVLVDIEETDISGTVEEPDDES